MLTIYDVAVIGIGRIGYECEKDVLRDKPASHVGACLACPEVNFVGVADVDGAKLEAFKAEHPRVAVYRSYRELMEKEKPQVVSVCTPVKSHAQILYDLVEYDFLRLIFMEKPLAHNVDAAKEMVKVCKENNIILMVNHTRRWSPTYRKVKEIVDSKVYGDLVRVVGYASREKDIQGNIHMFDLLSYLTDNNRDVWIYIDCPVNYLIFELQIILSNGKIQVLHNGRQVIVYEKKPSLHYTGINELVASETLQPYSFSEAMKNAVQNIVNCVKEKEKPYCDGNDGLRALRSYERWRKNGKKEEDE